MPDIPQPESLGSYVADLERRIRLLESAPRLKNASISDETNTTRAIFGQFSDGDFGVEVRNSGGITVYKVGGAGQIYPRQQLYVTRGNDYVIVTDSSYVTTWEARTPYVTADAVQVSVTISTDPATTADFYISSNVPATSAVVSAPANTSQSYLFRWAVPGMIVGSGTVTFQIWVRRTSGTGNVYVYIPEEAFVSSSASIGATPTGR